MLLKRAKKLGDCFFAKTIALNNSFTVIDDIFRFLDSGVCIQGNSTLWPMGKQTNKNPIQLFTLNCLIQL